MSQKVPTFSINKFINQVRDPDTDFTIIAFNDLIKFLDSVQEFDLPLETIQTDFLPNVISRLADKVPDIVNPVFRIIVLLSEKLPIASLSSFFEEIFNFVNDPECQIRNQILSVLREVLTNSISFAPDRQQTIVNFFINKLNENSDIEILIFNIDIMASLLECLGFLFDENDLKHAKELITTHIKDTRLDILPSVAALGRIWMYVAVMNGRQDQFNSMMKQLYEIGETNTNAFTILSSMVCYKPSIYKDEAVNLHALFYQRIQNEEEDLAKKQEEDPEIDIYYDTPYVPHITDCISSLTSLVKTFPELYNDDMVDDCISTSFTYLTYGITASNDDEVDNANEDDEDDFVIEGGEPGEVIELDEADDEVITGDDSWKIRKTAISLSIALIQNFAERFFESLGFRDEESDCLAVVNTLIKDSDPGSQNDAFEFLKVVIHYYKNELQEEDVFQWFSTLQMQLESKNNKSIVSNIIETISCVLKEYRKIPDDLLVKIITSTQSLLNNNTIQSLLCFVKIIFDVVQPTTHILQAIAITLTNVVNDSSISSTIPYIPIISELYKYAGPIESSITEDSECLEKLNDLGLSIVALCTLPENERVERSIQAFETLGVLVAAFKNDIFGLNDQSIAALVEAFENDSLPKALKIVCRSIALIAASPNNKIKLESFADRIRNKLLTIDFVHIDNTFLSICLQTLQILLKNEIIDQSSSECQSVAPYLAEIFSSTDPRNILLSASIFMLMPTAALQSLNSLRDSLTKQVLDHQIVMSYAKLVRLCATEDIKATGEFLISLIDKEYEKAHENKLDDITPNVAFVIGFVAGNIKELSDKLLQDFEEKLDLQNEGVLQFILQCVGEIGAFIDLSNREKLIDSVFALVRHQNREVFNAAAECLGHISFGSTNNILKRALNEANKDKDNTVWILVILSMVKRLSYADKDHFEIADQELQTIFEFLSQNADYDSPTEKSIAQSFSCLIKFKPQSYIDNLIELSKNKKASGPVAAHSIALFFEDVAKSDDPYYCFNFINKIMASVELDYPLVSEYFILCLKICLQIKQQYLNALSGASKINSDSEEVFENTNLFDYYELVCNATVFNPETHIVKINLGINSTVDKDIGINLRLNAVSCLILLFSIYSENVDVEDLFNIAYGLIKNDSKDEIKDQALALLTKMSLNKNVLDQLYEIITQRKEVFPEIEEIVYPVGMQKVDLLEENYLRLIIALRITESKKIKEIEEIYAKHKDDPKIKKFESDLSYGVIIPSPFAGILSTGSASASLMKEFCPEAFTIFLI